MTCRQHIDSLFEAPADVVLGHSSDGYTYRLYFEDPRGGSATADSEKVAELVYYYPPGRRDYAEVISVHVEPDYRRYGLATKLYQELKKELKLRGTKWVGGEVLSQIPFDIRNKVFGKPDMVSDDLEELPVSELRKRIPQKPAELGDTGSQPKVFVRNKVR